MNTFDDQDRVIRQEEGTRRMDIVYNVAYTRTTVTRTIKDQNGLNPYTAAFLGLGDALLRMGDETGSTQAFATYRALMGMPALQSDAKKN